jgi:anti-sigma factor ChrR (cupin superfamily)
VKASLFVAAQSLPWRPTPCAGVTWKKLYFDPESGESAVLLRFEAGATYDAHRHPEGESYLVLEGELEDGGRRYGPLTYVRHAAGSAHRPHSPTGALVFVSLPKPIEPLDAR